MTHPGSGSTGQLPLPIDAKREADRNFAKGGRSFYFFDFDDNVAHLASKIILFEIGSDREVEVSTSDFALIHAQVGKSGSPWAGFELRFEGGYNSYRNFRERPKEELGGAEQPLIQDLREALANPIVEWRGPSWDFFKHAVDNSRPVAIITARGHHPSTIKRAINLFVESGDLAASPNYLSVYPVSYLQARQELGDDKLTWSIAKLKHAAIKASVNDAFHCYGENPHHRFGMSDDDPTNIQLIKEAMRELKQQYPQNAFFVFNTHARQLSREEILLEGVKLERLEDSQMSLF